MDDAELIARLLETDWGPNVADTLTRWDKARTDAAARIEALTARLAELEDELDTWQSVFPDIAPERVLPDRSKLEARLAAAEGMAEALRRLRDCDWVISLPNRMDAVRDIARDALAKWGQAK